MFFLKKEGKYFFVSNKYILAKLTDNLIMK